MASRNSSERAYDNNKTLLECFADCSCPEKECSLAEYDESIEEINYFLNYARTHLEDEEEVAFWKRLLQQAKVEKRRMKAKMTNNMLPEVAPT